MSEEIQIKGITAELRQPSMFLLELERLTALRDTLAKDIRANNECAAHTTAKDIIALGTRLKRKLEKHMENLEFAECCLPGCKVSRLDGSPRYI